MPTRKLCPRKINKKYRKAIQTISSVNFLFHISLPSSLVAGIFFSVKSSVLLAFKFQLLTRTEVF